MKVHREGLLHRAFSVFLFDSEGKMLLQKRAASKYHSPKLWTNTCCSHQLPKKSLHECANQRLIDEMGINCDLSYQFKFHYRAELDDGLIENEIDHVYFGVFNDDPNPNSDEVMDWKYAPISEIEQDIIDHPEFYTVWFKILIKRVILQFKKNNPIIK